MPLPPFFWPAQLTCPLDPKRATGQTPHYPSGSSWHTVRKRHERPLHESPRPAKLHFWMCPGVTRESHGDPRTELGLLRVRAHLSMIVACKSDLVLSIWHPNATRAPNAPHSHTRETQGSAQVFTRGTSLYNKQPLEDRNMEPGCILVKGGVPRGRPATHQRENPTSPRRLPCSTDRARKSFSFPKGCFLRCSPRSPYCVWSTSRLQGGAKMANQGTAWQPEAILPPQ